MKAIKDRNCRMCGHPLSEHGINIAGEVYCQRDGCTLWIYCHRKEKSLLTEARSRRAYAEYCEDGPPPW